MSNETYVILDAILKIVMGLSFAAAVWGLYALGTRPSTES